MNEKNKKTFIDKLLLVSLTDPRTMADQLKHEMHQIHSQQYHKGSNKKKEQLNLRQAHMITRKPIYRRFIYRQHIQQALLCNELFSHLTKRRISLNPSKVRHLFGHPKRKELIAHIKLPEEFRRYRSHSHFHQLGRKGKQLRSSYYINLWFWLSFQGMQLLL